MDDKLAPDKLANMSNTELAQLSNEITGRLHNEDWQQIVHDLRSSGHLHMVFKSAPLFLQRYLRLESDLDAELLNLSPHAPLLSNIVLTPRRPRGNEEFMSALLTTQDTSASLQVDVQPGFALSSFAFGIKSMLNLRFHLPKLDPTEKRSFLDHMQRDKGITILWTPERWEGDFLVFLKQDFFTRVYAFSRNFDATARLTTEVKGTLLDWFERCWFPRRHDRRVKRTTQILKMITAVDDARHTVTPEQVTAFTQRLIKLEDAERADLLNLASQDSETLSRIFEGFAQQNTEEKRVAIVQDEVKAEPAIVERITNKLNELVAAKDLDKRATLIEPAPPDINQLLDEGQDASTFNW